MSGLHWHSECNLRNRREPMTGRVTKGEVVTRLASFMGFQIQSNADSHFR
jgi:hypothetical protein